MSTSYFFKSFSAGLLGAVIGLVFVAIANLVNPIVGLAQFVILVCVPAFLSGIVGYVIGGHARKRA